MRLRLGKVPPRILERIVFRYLGAGRSDVVLGPRLGEDAAIVEVDGQMLALSCDPVSGAVKKLGWVAVNVCCNDVASMGVQPRWFLGCIMLPEGARWGMVEKLCRQMDDAVSRLGVSIVGGHCEATPGLAYPLIIGFAAGSVDEGQYTTSAGAKPKDKVVLTKSAGIEGTAILASDRRRIILEKFGRKFVDRAEGFFEHISVVKDALTAFTHGGVHAMHDPTEGGIAGGLHEIADASGVGFEVHREKIPVEPETESICRLFRVDPLRLVSSGSLLISVSPARGEELVKMLRLKNISAAVIGDFVEDRTHRVIFGKSGAKPMHMPLHDELWTALRRNF